MPIYEYKCESCGAEFELLQKISDPPVEVCGKCGSKSVKKLVSRSGFVLKGGGWYKDHYGLKSSGGSASGDSSSGDSASGGASDSGSSTTAVSDASGAD